MKGLGPEGITGFGNIKGLGPDEDSAGFVGINGEAGFGAMAGLCPNDVTGLGTIDGL